MPVVTTLEALLDAELAYDPVTVQAFSDHLPMALVALDRLGADDARLAEFAEHYTRSLLPARDSVQSTRSGTRPTSRRSASTARCAPTCRGSCRGSAAPRSTA